MPVARGRLYLTSFSAHLAGGTPATIETLFANYSREYFDSVKANDPSNAGPGRFAFWCTGTLRCPFGELLEDVHAGYESIYEKELLLSFKDGFLVGQRIVNNERQFHDAFEGRAMEVVLTPNEMESELMHLRDREWRANQSRK